MIRKSAVLALMFLLVFSISPGPVSALSLSSDPPLLEFTPIATGLSSPIAMANAGDGSGRLFIIQQGGQIVIYDGTQVLATPFLDVSSLIVYGGEEGLLGVAFHPNYKTNGFFYVYYTRSSDGAIVIARYHVSADPNVADPTSASIILVIPHPSATNHNGGQLKFGPDGYLYIGTGDGGTGGANAQDGTVLLGKILRIDVNSGSPYGIPATNPFATSGSVRHEIWALGVRNPWRFSFDRLTGDLLIGDVGENTWEEVDFQKAGSAGGQNYGWPCYEGNHPYDTSADCTAIGTLTFPVLEYNHGSSDSVGCAIMGGYRYRGSKYPAMSGVYLFGDLCSGTIWGAAPSGSSWTSVVLANPGFNITTFGEDESGELYVNDSGAGTIYQIAASFFSDVPPSYWAWSWIQRLYTDGITTGCTSSPLDYCPDSPVTRAQMAVFLLRGIHGSSYTPPPASGSMFGDVPASYWAADWIEELANEGITVGCGAGNYCPDTDVTRAQMALLLLHSEHGASYVPPPPTGTVFGDVPASYWAAAWIEQLAAEGITGGCGGGNYCPDANVTRAQMAVFLIITFNLP